MSGILYLVATPIGNLGDMTYRGVEILKVADLIACEDKRVSMRLLAHYGIQKRLVTYNDINKFKAAPGLIRELKTGTQVALITDAGTPGISDPGFHLVNLALTEGIAVIPIPGPSALCAAIGPAGLPAHAFVFEGFLPPKGSKRRKRLERLRHEDRTIILYESPHRLRKILAELHEVLGNRRAVLARELTKIHEEFLRLSLEDLIVKYGAEEPRGEFVVMVAGKSSDD